MEIFGLNDYRSVLKSSLLDRKAHLSKSYTFEKMADACRVQKAYLSTVLNGTGHLNSDQVYMACDFLGFNALQMEYTSLIHEYERSVHQKRRKELLGRINYCRRQAKKSEAHIEAEVFETNEALLNEYFLNPVMILVHMYLTIDSYATNISKINDKLGIDGTMMTSILKVLGRMGAVEFRDNRYFVKKDTLHISPESYVFPIYRKLWRMKTIERFDQIGTDPDLSYSFSVTLSSDPETREKIQANFMKFLKSAQQLVKKGTQEKVYQMNFDLFSW